jgi:hypothetical protein
VRSSGRIPKEIPILLIGSDLGGKVFSEHTSTVLLSLHGAGILSRHKLSPEQELVLRWTERNKEAEIRVVGQVGSQDGQHTYGVAFFNPNLNFWEIDFPPVSAVERELGLLSLVCSHCKTLERVDDSSPEADVCATNDGVLRFCKRCGSSTLWKPAHADAPSDSALAPASGPAQFALFSSPSPATPAPAPQAAVLTMSPAHDEKSAASPANRRKHPRVKVSYSACVRLPGRPDEVVQCEDMSKGGLRFKSRQRYYAQSLIEVAVPYQPGQAAIFVPAQIVFAEELPEQRLFRCGVQYLKSTKPRDSF